MSVVICYCDGLCPNNEENSTCVLKRGGQCFSAVEEVYNKETTSFEAQRSFGCLPPEEKSLMQCMGDLVPHKYGKSIKCCNFTDLCNQNLLPEYKPHTTVAPPSNFLKDTHYVALLASFTVCLTLCFLLITIFYFRYKKRVSDPYNKLFHKAHNTLQDVINLSSGSGAGCPVLVPRTISKQIELINQIGKGRYSEVWLAHFKGEKIAVRQTSLLEEDNWLHERKLYSVAHLRHKNILGIIAADKKSGPSGTQLLLITDYYKLGSLYDYLNNKNKVLDTSDLIRFAKSAATAINYLHTEIFAEHGKPGVVHRDIKSKNFLINNVMECVLMDFGMAAIHSRRSNRIDFGKSTRVGTKRYMAPEILERKINMNSFDDLKMADIYALSLVFWEMCRKCVTSDGVRLRCEDYAFPYYDVVPEHPSLEEMKEAVCVKKIRPFIPERWSKHQILKACSKLMQECWNHHAPSRLTALRIKKTLENLETTCVNIRIV